MFREDEVVQCFAFEEVQVAAQKMTSRKAVSDKVERYDEAQRKRNDKLERRV